MRGEGGGGGSRSIWHMKKSSGNVLFICLVLNLFYRKSSGYFQRKLLFAKLPVGVEHFPGGSNFLQGGPIAFHL